MVLKPFEQGEWYGMVHVFYIYVQTTCIRYQSIVPVVFYAFSLDTVIAKKFYGIERISCIYINFLERFNGKHYIHDTGKSNRKVYFCTDLFWYFFFLQKTEITNKSFWSRHSSFVRTTQINQWRYTQLTLAMNEWN